MARRRLHYPELTSLLDVLFILVFASLVHAAALVQQARESAEKAPPPPPRTAPAARPAAAKPAAEAPAAASGRARIRRNAIGRLLALLRKSGIAYARISATGVLTGIEVEERGRLGSTRTAVPLLQRVPDPDVALAYLGDQSPGLRVCSLVRLNLGRKNLARQLVVFVPEVPLSKLPFALVEGLQRDQERCFADEQGMGVLVDPKEGS